MNELLQNKLPGCVGFREAAATWWSHGRHLWEPGQLYGKLTNMKPYYKSVRGYVLKSVDWALENLNRPTG